LRVDPAPSSSLPPSTYSGTTDSGADTQPPRPSNARIASCLPISCANLMIVAR
jgi:hypothetical protein